MRGSVTHELSGRKRDPQTGSLQDCIKSGGWREAFDGTVKDGFGPDGLGDEDLDIKIDLRCFQDVLCSLEEESIDKEPVVPSAKADGADDVVVFVTHAAAGLADATRCCKPTTGPSRSAFDANGLSTRASTLGSSPAPTACTILHPHLLTSSCTNRCAHS